MFSLLLLLVSLIGWGGIFAATVAVILDLPVSFGQRFLLIMLSLWGFYVLRAISKLREQMERQTSWMRLSFITLHLRNEKEGLPSAAERLREDLATERMDKEFGGNVDEWGWLIPFAMFFVILGAMLHLGWFGEFGVGWLAKLSPPR